MTPVFGIDTASCGKKLLRISEHFSGSYSMITLLKARWEFSTILANFMNCTIISNAVGLKNLVILT